MSGLNKAEKRSVFTDALETLGTIITNKPGCARDAIHIAVEPCIASAPHHPGERIGIAYDEGILYSLPVYGPKREVIGIVDPFLTHPVGIGETFWLLVLPRKITSLRHVWDHPKFHPSDTTSEVPGPCFNTLIETDENGGETRTVLPPKPGPNTAASEQWMQEYANEVDLTYDELMAAATKWIEYGEYLCDGGKFEGVNVPDGFWSYYFNITGLNGDGSFFTCSC